jgi:hypothetical protein
MSNKIIRRLDNRQTIVLNQSLATSSSFSFNIAQFVRFVPKYIIIRQLLYCNIGAGTDNGIYLLWCSLSGHNIGAVYAGIQGVGLTPETILTLPNPPQPTISFNLTPANAAFTGPTGQLAITVEFVEGEI